MHRQGEVSASSQCILWVMLLFLCGWSCDLGEVWQWQLAPYCPTALPHKAPSQHHLAVGLQERSQTTAKGSISVAAHPTLRVGAKKKPHSCCGDDRRVMSPVVGSRAGKLRVGAAILRGRASRCACARLSLRAAEG